MTGAELIAQERQRQIEEEGWQKEHDVALHPNGELALAAMCYAAPYQNKLATVTALFKAGEYPEAWPWERLWWKPTPDDRIRELVKAGALIAAEIDRLQSVEEH